MLKNFTIEYQTKAIGIKVKNILTNIDDVILRYNIVYKHYISRYFKINIKKMGEWALIFWQSWQKYLKIFFTKYLSI